MNMGTAMKAVGTGWKQSGTTDNGKGRDAGKADFADTFTEMLKAGKKASESRKQTQNTQKAAEAQKITVRLSFTYWSQVSTMSWLRSGT